MGLPRLVAAAIESRKHTVHVFAILWLVSKRLAATYFVVLSQRIQVLAQILSNAFVGQNTRLQTKVLREYLNVINVHSAEVKALFEERQHRLQIRERNKFVFSGLNVNISARTKCYIFEYKRTRSMRSSIAPLFNNCFLSCSSAAIRSSIISIISSDSCLRSSENLSD